MGWPESGDAVDCAPLRLRRRSMITNAATTMITPITMRPSYPGRPKLPDEFEELATIVRVAFDHATFPFKAASTVSVTVPVLDPAVKTVDEPVAEFKVPILLLSVHA